MVGVEVSVGVGIGVSVRVWVGSGVEEGSTVSVSGGVSVGVTEGEGEIEGEITNPAVGAEETASVSPGGIPSVRGTGKLHAIPRTIQITPSTAIRICGGVWFPVCFISTFSAILA